MLQSQECVLAIYQHSWDWAAGKESKWVYVKIGIQHKKLSCMLIFTTLSTKVSWIDSSMNSLPAAMQFSPLLKNTELIPCRQKVCVWKVHNMSEITTKHY